MTQLISPVACPQALDLFDSDLHLAVLAAFAGETPAELYIDDAQTPHAGLLIVGDHRFYLAGKSDDDAFSSSLITLLHERYVLDAPGETPFECALTYTPPAWEARLRELLGGVQAMRVERQYFELDLSAPIRALAPPDGFRLRRLDEVLIAETSLVNRAALVAEIHSEAPSVSTFLQRKFGYCLQYGNELVAWCLSEYNHLQRCELGIETMPPFRRRGLASVVASATISHAQSVGITAIGWHCWASNTASRHLALSLGFAHVADYPVSLCRFENTD